MATAFPRDIPPGGASWLKSPGPLLDWVGTGKGQAGLTGQIGRSWRETWPPIKGADVAVQAFLAKVAFFWTHATVLDVEHYSKRTRLGAGGGSPLVKGANQTGNSILTDGWPNNTAVLKAGDLVRLGALLPVFEVRDDVTSDGSGNATLVLNPRIIAGGSPPDNAVIATNPGIKFRAIIAEEPNWPDCPANEFYQGFGITFREWLS